MALRTARQYLDSLRDDRVVYYAGERVKDAVDDPTQAVKAIVVTPNKRRHVFLSSSLRKRAPPVGGAR